MEDTYLTFIEHVIVKKKKYRVVMSIKTYNIDLEKEECNFIIESITYNKN